MTPSYFRQNGFSRRDSLRMLGAAGAMSLFGGAVSRADTPATPATDLQGAGFYRFNVGDVKITVVSDGVFPFNPPFPLFGANASEEAVKKTLADHFIEYDQAMGHVHAMVIDNGRDKILVDTGCGQLFGPTTGKLIPRLANAGFKPADINTVLLTHAHPDHFGGVLDADGKPAFANAEHLVSDVEYKFWTGTPDLSKSGAPDEQKKEVIAGAQKVLAGQKWTPVEGEKEIRAKVRVVPAPGHTPGHLTLLIDGGGTNQLYYITDAVHHFAIMMPHPEYYVAFDTDRDIAVSTRRKIFDRASSDKLLIAGTHLPFPAVGHVKSAGQGYEFVPTVWSW